MKPRFHHALAWWVRSFTSVRAGCPACEVGSGYGVSCACGSVNREVDDAIDQGGQAGAFAARLHEVLSGRYQ